MPLVCDAAIILQTFPYSDTSKILRLLTQQHGVQSVIARGALRPKSRYGGVLEPFTEGTASFFLRDRRDLQTLSAFELTRSRQPLGTQLIRFGGASLLAELIMRVGSSEADAALFQALRESLDIMEAAPAELLESTVLSCTWAVVALLGFAPVLDQCLDCGRARVDEEDGFFDYAAGGVRCTRCGSSQGGRLVPGTALDTLSRLAQGEAVQLTRTAGHWRLLSRFLSHHVLEGQTLHSLAFLSSVLDHAT